MDSIFNSTLCAQYVESLVQLDEVERALWVLDNVPAYYRDHYPPELQKLKEEILASLCTAHAYMISNLDGEIDLNNAKLFVTNIIRGRIVREEVERFNSKGITPHLIDMGPGEYLVPLGLKELGLKFTYTPIGVDLKAQQRVLPDISALFPSEPIKERPVVFMALEIIEHLPSTKDLCIEAFRWANRRPERIHLSTPCYTFDTEQKQWRKPCGLPHLRAYTPQEFAAEAAKLFPGYKWEMYPSQLTSLRGVRADSIDDGPITFVG